MPQGFSPTEQAAAQQVVELALQEDLQDAGDITCAALIDETMEADVQIVARQSGILAGMPAARLVFESLDPAVQWSDVMADGSQVEAGMVVASLHGRLRSLLTGERTALNFVTHLSGIASLTRQFVDQISGTISQILDTRKTLPGWRLLEKYAVRTGGGLNHRIGLFDAVLIKDNHLAGWSAADNTKTIVDAIQRVRQSVSLKTTIQVEVDTLEQLREALNGSPDMILLDNMSRQELVDSVRLRDEVNPQVMLEASGGVTLETVHEIAESGVDRISVGALTHSARALDLAFDWKD